MIIKLDLPLRIQLGLAEPQQCFYLVGTHYFYSNPCACKTQGSRRMELFGDVKECQVCLHLSSIPESIPAGHESVNGRQCF